MDIYMSTNQLKWIFINSSGKVEENVSTLGIIISGAKYLISSNINFILFHHYINFFKHIFGSISWKQSSASYSRKRQDKEKLLPFY